MSLEIRVLTKFQLRTQNNNPFVLVLPVIELAKNGNNIPYISRVTHSVEGTPKKLAEEIKKAYKDFEAAKPQPLDGVKRLNQGFCTLNQPLVEPVNCTLEVKVKYFDSDADGNLLLSEPKHIQGKCYLYSEDLFLGLKVKLSALEQEVLALKPQLRQLKVPTIDSDLVAKLSAVEQQIFTLKAQLNISHFQSKQPEVNKMNPEELKQNNSNGQQKPYPGWLAIDFGTSNSTVTLFDPAVVEKVELLHKEQQIRLLERLAEWLNSSAIDALPGVNPSEWEKFINNISQNLKIDPTQLHEVFQGESPQRCLEAIRQIELCLGRNEQFRRAISKKLYQIYHDVFRVPTLESQNLIPVVLDPNTGSPEIPSELEITSLTSLPLEVEMGVKANQNKKKAIDENINTSNSSELEKIISRFHHSPKRYFGQERKFPVTVDEKQETITVNQLIQAAWGNLIKLTDKYRQDPSRKFSQGEFQTAVVTYPTIAPPIVRKQVKQLVEELGIKDVQTAYDEAVAVVMFFLWREFGGYLNIGIESFKTRCRREDHKWSQNVLVLDIGGGTTDLALIKLTLEDTTPSFKDKKDRGLGGRYYQITPKLLGSSGHLQLGGELITLRMFRLLKVAIVDCLLTAITTGELESQTLKDRIRSLDKSFRQDEDKYKEGSLLKCIDKEYPERESAYKDALDAAEQVLPTRWKEAPERLQTFYTLWDYAEAAKIQLGKKPSENGSPLTFSLSEQQITELLNQAEIDDSQGQQNFNNFSVTLKSEQFKRAASSVITEAVGIAKGLMESRLKDDNDNQQNSKPEKGKVDWLILSGKTCNLDIVQSKIYEEFSKSKYFVWNPERITFSSEFTKLATSAGACYAEKMRQLRFSPEDAKPLLQKGANQLSIDVKNLFYYLPCNFRRKTQTSVDFLDIFKAGQELYQISLNDQLAKLRNDWSGIQLSNIIYRQDYENGQLQLWGSFDGNNLLHELNNLQPDMNEKTFLDTIKIQFEIDSSLVIGILLCRGEAHYLIDDSDGNGINVTQEAPGLFSPEKLNHGDIAVNVLEANAVDQPNACYVVLEATKEDIHFKKFHYSSDNNQPSVNGLISQPLPEFPESGKHTFYICDVDTEKNEEKWVRIGELSKPDKTPEFDCPYRVSLDEKGMLRLHVGEVPYWESDDKKCLLEEGWVFRTELDLQPNEVDKERDPFCGIH